MKITASKKKMEEAMIACRRVFVAIFILTPGTYCVSGVKVRSELISPPAIGPGSSFFFSFFACLLAASDLKVGRDMAESLMAPVQQEGGWPLDTIDNNGWGLATASLKGEKRKLLVVYIKRNG